MLEVEPVHEGAETEISIAPAGGEEVEDQVAHRLAAEAVETDHEPSEGHVDGVVGREQRRDVEAKGEGVEKVEQLAVDLRVEAEQLVEVGQVHSELPQVRLSPEHPVEESVERELGEPVGPTEVPERLELCILCGEHGRGELDSSVRVLGGEIGVHEVQHWRRTPPLRSRQTRGSPHPTSGRQEATET